jgi:hypothetical protein
MLFYAKIKKYRKENDIQLKNLMKHILTSRREILTLKTLNYTFFQLINRNFFSIHNATSLLIELYLCKHNDFVELN